MRVGKVLKLILMALLFVTLGACAGIHKQAFNKAAHENVKTIALLEPASKEEYAVANLGHAGMGFGLIGGLIAAADMQSKTDQFTELMKARNFRLADEFQNILSTELQNVGYTVRIVKPVRENTGFLESYDDLDKDVDAYLDSGVGAGYMCASGSADYIPTVRSGVRLVKNGSKEIIYQDLVAYGYEYRRAEAITIAAGQKYFFKDFGELEKEPDRALEGLRKGIPLVAKRIAQDLSR